MHMPTHMSVNMPVHMSVHTCLCTYLCTHAYAHVYTHMPTHMSIAHACAHACAHVYAHAYAHVYAHACAHAYAHAHAHVYAHVYAHCSCACLWRAGTWTCTRIRQITACHNYTQVGTSASPTARLLRGYGRGGAQNDRLGGTGVPALGMTASPEHRHAHTRNRHAVGDAEIEPVLVCMSVWRAGTWTCTRTRRSVAASRSAMHSTRSGRWRLYLGYI